MNVFTHKARDAIAAKLNCQLIQYINKLYPKLKANLIVHTFFATEPLKLITEHHANLIAHNGSFKEKPTLQKRLASNKKTLLPNGKSVFHIYKL